MAFFDWLFGKKSDPAPAPPQHGVIVHFTYGSTDLTRLFAIEEQLERAIVEAGVGMFDGNDVAVDGSDANLYMYGPDGDALFAAVRPVLEAEDCMKGARVTLQYGPPEEGVGEVVVVLDAPQGGAPGN